MPSSALWRILIGGVLLASLGCAERRRAAEPPPAPPPAAPTPPPEPEITPEQRACGTSGMPDCPLQAWMDSRLNSALSDGNFAAVARSLRELAEDPPPGFDSWSRWARAGADAADRQDQTSVRAACTGCHDENRENYRRTIRHRPLRTAAAY